MRPFNISRVIVCCLVACGAFFVATNQAKADLILTATGVVDFSNSEFVGTGESYTAVFDIDHSVEGVSGFGGFVNFAGAIRSSSFNFSGGHTITDEFAGGQVRISPGSVVFISTSLDSTLSLLFDSTLEEPLESLTLKAGPQEISTRNLGALGSARFYSRWINCNFFYSRNGWCFTDCHINSGANISWLTWSWFGGSFSPSPTKVTCFLETAAIG